MIQSAAVPPALDELELAARVASPSLDAPRWALEPGTFQLAAGSSSAELPMSTEVTVA